MRKLTILIVLVALVGLVAGCGVPRQTVRPETVEETLFMAEAVLMDANMSHQTFTEKVKFYSDAGVFTKEQTKAIVDILKEASIKLDEAGVALDIARASSDLKGALDVKDGLVPTARAILQKAIVLMVKYQNQQSLCEPCRKGESRYISTGIRSPGYFKRARESARRTDMEFSLDEERFQKQMRLLTHLIEGKITPQEYDFLVGAEKEGGR